MASKARDRFLEGLAAFRLAVDEESVRRADPQGDFLRRGVTVAGFNLLETFIENRLEECAEYYAGL